MAFKAPPKILQKVMGFKALTHNDGKVELWGTPVTIIPNVVNLYYHQLLRNNFDKKEINKAIFHVGSFQAERGVKIINERFGYAETLKDKKDILEFNLGQLDVLGLGAFHFEHTDFAKNNIIVKGISVYAQEHKRFFGPTKETIDFFLMGILHRAAETICKDDLIITEEKCYAQGATYCEFVIKPIKSVNVKDNKYKDMYQIIKSRPSFENLGGHIDPLTHLK